LCLAAGADFRLSPGAIELFEALQRRRIKFTIATASGYDNLQFFIKHLDLGQWFELDTIIYDDGTLQGKPNPDIYLKAAKNIHCNPVDCVVVEDSISGIQSAQQARIGCVVGIESKPVRSLVPPVDRMIRDLREFPVKELFDCD
jgi:HAD superfamily hydrolase (TIGR01509 family)